MKKLLGIVVLGLLLSGNAYAGSIIVCENIKDGMDRVAVSIDKKQKVINWNNEIDFQIYDSDSYGTGRYGSPMMGDIWGMDKSGTMAIAINAFTYKARRKNSDGEYFYDCRKVDKNKMLF